MKKFLLATVAALALATSAVAAPYKVQDANGNPLGPVIGPGEVIMKAPDGTPVALHVGPLGFANDVGALFLPFIWLGDKTCTSTAYLPIDTVPVRGVVDVTGGGFFGPSATIGYPTAPYTTIEASVYSLELVNHGVSGIGYACTLNPNPLPVGTPIGPVSSFTLSSHAPFSVVPWIVPDTDPPTQ